MSGLFDRVEIVTSLFWRLLPQGMRRRWWLFRIFDGFARRLPVFKARRGLLAIRMDGIGDMVLFRQSLEHYPEAFGVESKEIIVLGCDSWSAISQEVFDGIKVITINEHKYARHFFYRFLVNIKVRQLVPAITVVDAYFRRALMSDSLAWVANAQRTVVALPYMNKATEAEFNWYMSQEWEIIKTGSYPIHETIRHASFVAAVSGHKIKARTPVITWNYKQQLENIGETYAVLNPGSNEHGRRWPMAKYVDLALWLRTMGLAVVFVGKASENTSTSMFGPLGEDKGIIDMTGNSTLPELLGIMKGATIVISNDTGPAHLAIALGAKTVVIVGGGHFGCFFPYPDIIASRHARFVYKRMDCYHCFWRCHKRTDPKASFPCVESVPSAYVEAACEELLALDQVN